MTAGAPWSVKGIDPKAREVAKDLARRSGMTLGELLNRLILEDEDQSLSQPSYLAAVDRLEAEPQPNPFATSALASSMREPYREEPRTVADAPSRFRAPEHPADEVGRVTAALERLSERIEAAERRSTLAISGIDQSVRGVIGRIDAAERENISVAARFEGAVDELKTEQTRSAERLRRVEQEAHGPRSAEALKALEQALGKVASHLYDGEARTRSAVAEVEARVARMESESGQGHNQPPIDTAEIVDAVVGRIGERLENAESRTADAIVTLGASFSALDGRLSAVEQSGGAADRRLEELAANLSRRMEAARVEMAQKLRETADGRFDRIESRLAEMAAHVTTAEQRSAQAIERMGREVVSMADSLGRRVQASETRSAEVIEQVGGEVARIASAMEARVSRADNVQAQALEKLGGEIARITERLAERIANAERRNALAIDDVGEQVARVTERIGQRSERATSDLAERIRQSEERTARLLEEARERIDSGLAVTQRKIVEHSAPPPTAATAPPPSIKAPQHPSPFADDPFFSGPSGGESIPEDAFASASFPPAGFEAAAFPAPEPTAPSFADEDFAAADGFAPGAAVEPEPEPIDYPEASEPWVDPTAVAADTEAFESEVVARPLSTREVIEQARAAARAAMTNDKKAKGKKVKPEKADKLKPLGGEPEPGRSLFGLGKSKARQPASDTMQKALMVSAVCAVLGAGATLYTLGEGAKGSGETPQRVMQARAAAGAGVVNGPEADTTPKARAQTALAIATPPAEATTVAAANGPALFADAKAKIEAKNPTGVAAMREAANLGYTPAQFYLAKLYENGELGMKKDLAEARRWTERAAQGGDRGAMHNLGLYYYQGQGGPKNPTIAATWFRKAADLGLVDSQYNLAQLYEVGAGVPANAAEAYKWYLIASRGGDTDSKAAGTRLKATLSAEAQAAAERSAFGFRAAAPNPSLTPTRVASLSPDVGLAQRALNRLGYYQGPTDGSSSPAFGMAVAAYQRDQALKVTGTLDAETSQKLSVFAR